MCHSSCFEALLALKPGMESEEHVSRVVSICTISLLPKMHLREVCLQALERSSPARIISLSSAAHQFPRKINMSDLHYHHKSYSKQMAYGYAKLANVLFARELAKR